MEKQRSKAQLKASLANLVKARKELEARKKAINSTLSSDGPLHAETHKSKRIKAGHKFLGRTKLSDNQFLCASCHNPLQLVTAVTGMIRAGFHSELKEVYLNPLGEEVDAHQLPNSLVEKAFTKPILKKVRVCPACIRKLDSIVPSWQEQGTLAQGANENHFSSRRDPIYEGKSIDPSWMTSRGKRF